MVSDKLSRASFAVAVKMHRDRLALSQAEAAALLDISPRTLWQWENEERDTPRPTQIGALEILKFAKKKTQGLCKKCGARTGHASGVCVTCQPDWPSEK